MPHKYSLILDIIKEYNDSAIGCHSREKKTYKRGVVEVFWSGMRTTTIEDIKKNAKSSRKTKPSQLYMLVFCNPFPSFLNFR